MLTGTPGTRPAYCAAPLGDQGAETGLGGLRARLALNRDSLRGAHVVALVGGDLRRLAGQLVRAVQDHPVTVAVVHDEARDALAVLERLDDVREVLRVAIGGVGAILHRREVTTRPAVASSTSC